LGNAAHLWAYSALTTPPPPVPVPPMTLKRPGAQATTRHCGPPEPPRGHTARLPRPPRRLRRDDRLGPPGQGAPRGGLTH
jgi:hypothetical protein